MQEVRVEMQVIPERDPADLPAETVMVGYVHNGTLRQEFHASVLAMLYHDSATGRRVVGELSASGPYIADNRNTLVKRFLEKDADWLWMFDIDIDFPPQLISHVLDAADKDERPIVGVVYFTRLEADGGKHWLPVWMEDGEHGELTVVRALEIGELRELTSTGAGCTLIHRSVLEKMQVEYAEDPWHWFGHDIVDDRRCGEDVTFCLRARRMGYPIYGLTLPVTHIKTTRVGWQEFVGQPDIEGWKR